MPAFGAKKRDTKSQSAPGAVTITPKSSPGIPASAFTRDNASKSGSRFLTVSVSSGYNNGDYIKIPRGRVIWDTETDRAIIYLDRCIEKANGAIMKIVREFDLINYVIEYDEHYSCPECIGDIWGDF